MYIYICESIDQHLYKHLYEHLYENTFTNTGTPRGHDAVAPPRREGLSATRVMFVKGFLKGVRNFVRKGVG